MQVHPENISSKPSTPTTFSNKKRRRSVSKPDHNEQAKPPAIEPGEALLESPNQSSGKGKRKGRHQFEKEHSGFSSFRLAGSYIPEEVQKRTRQRRAIIHTSQDSQPRNSEQNQVAQKNKLFFRIGPPFKRTCQNFDMVDSKGQNIYAILDSRIDRGFQLTNEGWLTYKHNYITVSSSFSLTTSNPVEYGVIPKSNIYAKAGNTQLMIRYFSLRMVAFQLNSNNTLTEREIFQQSAKRNQSVLYPSISVVPGKLPTHDYIKNNTTYRSLLRRKIIDHDISYRKTDLGPFAQYYPDPLGIHYVALFERLQFSGGDGQRCKLVIQLVAMLENEIPYVVSWSETPYFLLRSKSSFLYENQPATSKNWEDNAKSEF